MDIKTINLRSEIRMAAAAIAAGAAAMTAVGFLAGLSISWPYLIVVAVVVVLAFALATERSSGEESPAEPHEEAAETAQEPE